MRGYATPLVAFLLLAWRFGLLWALAIAGLTIGAWRLVEPHLPVRPTGEAPKRR